TSPSMDIQVSSNFERLLFEAGRRSSEAVRRSMDGLRQSGAFTIDPQTLAAIRAEFDAGRTTMDEAAETIRFTLARNGYLLDPHTATAVHIARQKASAATPMIV